MSEIQRFYTLFQGNKRSFGQWDPTNGRMQTQKFDPPLASYEAHLRGDMGLGIVPILDNGRCWFGVIDIDAHGDNEFIDLVALERSVRSNDLPLLVCRSKSGGAHLYLFGQEALPAEDIRTLLSTWASRLGFPGVEVFPKQSKLPIYDGEQSLGNWINLPYFKCHKTDRYMVEGGHPVDFDFFLSAAETRKISAETLTHYVKGEHGEAPPCVEALLSKPIEVNRNESLFAIAVYFRKKYPDDWRDRVLDLNGDRNHVTHKLEAAEVRKITDSIRKRDYGYRCAQEPCNQLCNREECLKREFGISPEDAQLESLLSIQKLIKVDTRPATYYLVIDGQKCVIDSVSQLASPIRFREILIESTNRYLPKITQREFDVLMGRLFENLEVLDAPNEASAHGAILSAVEDYLHRVNIDVDYSDPHTRMPVMAGQPIIYVDSNDKKFYAFKSDGLRNFLKKAKSVDVPQAQTLFNTLSLKYTVKTAKLKIADMPDSKRPRVWMIPHDEVGDPIEATELPPQSFEEEI